MAGRMINGAAALAELVRPAGETDRSGLHRVLPVVPELSGLLPGGGLRRGSTVAVVAGWADSAAGPMAASSARPATALPASPMETSAAPSSAAPSADALPVGSMRSSVAASPARPVPAGPFGTAARAKSSASLTLAPAPSLTPGAPGNGGTSLLLALLSAASRSGSWCAVVGVPALGVLAAAESGIALDRLALVPNPGPDWPTVVAALIDGVDVVVTAVPPTVSAAIAGRLVARARQRGSVLVPYGRWAGADVTLQVTQGRWEGLGDGRGRLRRRRVTVLARGRGAATRPREITLWMPGVDGPAGPTPPVGAGRRERSDHRIGDSARRRAHLTSVGPA
jgi:hypothetical protein